jgi:hypothetical protein
MFQYGSGEVCHNNYQRLLSAKSQRAQAELVVGHGFLIYPAWNRIFLLDNLYIELNTSAAPSNRYLTLQVLDKQGMIVWAAGPTFVQAAGKIVGYSFCRSVSSSTVLSPLSFIELPTMPIFEDNVVEIFVDGIVLGDVISGGQYSFRDLIVNENT